MQPCPSIDDIDAVADILMAYASEIRRFFTLKAQGVSASRLLDSTCQ